VNAGLVRMGIDPTSVHQTSDIPDLSTLPAPIRELFEQSFGIATGHIFLAAVPFAVLAFLCVLLIKEVPLRTTIQRSDELDPQVAAELRS
jgi:hypothetical protein